LEDLMSDEKKENLADIEDLDVEPLTDEDLESVAGGLDDCSCTYTGSSCTGGIAV
jgi:tRNA(Phe) wybutosine-synthesizing methylase Tyw3